MKHVISLGHGVGFFSMFTQVLTLLDEYHDREIITYWNSNTLYWDPNGWNGSRNVWEYYFEPTSQVGIRSLLNGRYDHHSATVYNAYHNYWEPQSYDPAVPELENMRPADFIKLVDPEVLVTTGFAHHRTGWGGGGVKDEDRPHLKSILDKRLKIKPVVLKQADIFTKKLAGRNIVGIHFRGTDKHTELQHIGEYDGKGVIPIEDYLKILDGIDNRSFVYLATDSQPAFDIAQQRLGSRLLSMPGWHRAPGERGLHAPGLYSREYPFSKAQHGEQAVLDWLLLSRCDYFIHGFSNLSAAVLFMNPTVQHLNVYKHRI